MNKIVRSTVKSRVLFPVVLAAATICICILCCNFISQNSYRAISELFSSNAVAASELRAPQWTVKEYKGKIGIFGADGNLCETLEVSVSTLPSQDREYLISGISVYSVQELLSIIEDYTG